MNELGNDIVDTQEQDTPDQEQQPKPKPKSQADIFLESLKKKQSAPATSMADQFLSKVKKKENAPVGSIGAEIGGKAGDVNLDSQSNSTENNWEDNPLNPAYTTLKKRKENKITLPSKVLESVQIDDDDVPAEILDKKGYKTALQKRLIDKTPDELDLQVISKKTGKPIESIAAYSQGRDGKGVMIEFDDIKLKKGVQLSNLVNKANKELGLADTFENVFASPEEMSGYLDKIQRLYDEKTGREYQAQKDKVVNQVSEQGKKAGMDYTDEGFVSDKSGLAAREYLAPIKQANDVVVSTIKSIIRPEILKAVNNDDKLTYEQKIKKAGKLGFGMELEQINQAKAGRIKNDAEFNVVSPLLQLGRTLLRDEDTETKNLNSINAVVETQINNEIQKSLIYEQADLANTVQEAMEKAESGKLTDEEKVQYEQRIANLKTSIEKRKQEYKTPKQLQSEYPILLKQSVINDINEFNAIQSGNIKGYGDAGYRGIGLREHLKAQGYDMNSQVVKDAVSDAESGVGIKDYSFFGEPIKAVKDVFVSSLKSIGDITGIRDDVTALSEKTEAELFPTQVLETDEYQLTSGILGAETWQNIGNTSGGIVGQGLLQMATGGLGRMAGLTRVASANLGFWSSGALTSYDQAYKESFDFIDSGAGRTAYAGLIALSNAASEKIFPESKVFNIPAVKNAVREFASKVGTEQMTDELANQLLKKTKNAFVDWAVKSGANISKETIEETATNLFQSGARFVFGDENVNFEQALIDAKNTAIQTAIGTTFIGGIGGYRDVQSQKNISPSSVIYNAAIYKDDAMDALQIGLDKGLYSEQVFNQKVSLLNTAEVGVSDLKKAEQVIGRELSRPQKELFVANATAQKLLNEHKKEVKDQATIDKIDTKLDNLLHQQNQLLDNKVQFDEFGNVVADTKLSVPIEGLDEQGIPIGDNVPAPEKIFTDFDKTLFDKGKLTPLGEEIKAKIENGEDITILTARENTPENIDFIARTLGLPHENIKAGLDPDAKAAELTAFNGTKVFYDDNPDNVAAAQKTDARVIDTGITSDEQRTPTLFRDLQETGEANEYLNPEKITESIEEIQNQALTAPSGIKKKVGEKLTLELIARNTVEDINKAIETWQKKVSGEEVSEYEIKDADRHIRLLEKGLEQKAESNVSAVPPPTEQSSNVEGKEASTGVSMRDEKVATKEEFNDAALNLATLDLEDSQVKYPKVEGRKQTMVGSGNGYNLYLLDREKMPEKGPFEISIQDDNGESIGFIRGTKSDKTISINLIHLQEENRGKGIGTDIYEKLLDEGYTIKSDKEITDDTYSLYDRLGSNDNYERIVYNDGRIGVRKKSTAKDQSLSSNTPSKEQATKPEIKNEEAKVTEDIKQTEGDVATESKVDKTISPATEGEEGGKEPPSDKEKSEGEGNKPLKDKGILNRLYDAENVPESAKIGFKDKGLKYKPESREEKAKVAKAIVEELGVERAVLNAKALTFDDGVNSAIFAESLTVLKQAEDKATSKEEKFNAAKEFARVSIEYDEWARGLGREISQIQEFYESSPLGIVIKQNIQNQKEFDKWAKPKEQSWNEFFDELNNIPEFKEFVDKKVQDEVKKERAENRKTRVKKVNDTIDGWIKDINSGKALFATPVPPPVLIAALKTAKAAWNAGEHITKIVQDGIDFITEKLGDSDWNIEGWKKKLESAFGGESKNALEKYKDRLTKKKESLQEQIANRKRESKKNNKTELDDEAKGMIEEIKELEKQLENIAPLSETQEYQLAQLEKFRKKLKGLSESEKDEVIRNSFTELINNGALSQEDFRRIIAHATGRGDLTAEQSARMKELVRQTNAVEAFSKRFLENKTEKSYEDYKKSQVRAAKAARDLADMFDKKADYLKVIASSLQGNTLSLTNVFVMNPAFNVINQWFFRLPIGAMQSLTGAMVGKQEWNTVFSGSTQKQFFKELWKGLKEANVQLVTGMSRSDYDAKEIYTDQIRPLKSTRELWHQIRSSKQVNALARLAGKQEVERKEKLTNSQLLHRAFQVAPGTTAELIFRLLNYGDKPMRFGAGGATAAAFANSLGIKSSTMDWNVFMEFPREEAYRLYKAKGLSDKDASDKADTIKESILQEGKRSTLQQDNLFSDIINGAFNKLENAIGARKDSGAGQLAKSTLVSPYLKIPSNAFWAYFTAAHPVIALAEATGHIIASQRHKNNGDNVKANLQAREARYWVGHAAVGIALNAIIIPLVKSGVITPSSDDDDPKKEREGEKTYAQDGTFDVTKFYAFITGSDPNKVKESFTIPLRMLGTLGMVSNSLGRDWDDMDNEERQNQNLLTKNLLEFWDTDDLKELQNGIFSNSSALVGAMGGSGSDRYFINLINLYGNLVHPSAIAQISRAQLPYYTRQKADSFAEELNNSLLTRSSLYRNLTNQYPPTKFNIWGQPMKKDDNFWFRLLGFNRTTKDNFAQPIFEDAKKTNDIGFFPPAVGDKLNGKKLNTEQYNKLQEYVGQARKLVIEPYINDVKEIPGYGLYSKITDNEIKKDRLAYMYGLGRMLGLQKLYVEFPELKPPTETPEEKVNDKQRGKSNKVLKKEAELLKN